MLERLTKHPQDFGTIGPLLLRPTSRGSIKLADNSAFTPPRILPNYLSTSYDRDILLYGLRLVIKILHTQAMKGVFDGWYTPWFNPANEKEPSDAELRRYLRENADTIYHPMGTAKMGPREDEMDVVDHRLRVHGVDGLRVVDASVSPTPLACHTCAPVVAVAEKAADLIKEDNGHS
jgi:choline dehydrogenase